MNSSNDSFKESNFNVSTNIKLNSKLGQVERKYLYESSDTSAKSRTQRGQNDEHDSDDQTDESPVRTDDDAYSEYATDDYGDNTERMQLNPSTDFYDDYEDDETDDGTYDESDEEPARPDLVPIKYVRDEEEEEDMGYDEDDERIAITIERPKEHANARTNIEESVRDMGGGTNNDQFPSRLDDKRYLGDSRRKYQRKKQNLWTESGKGDEVDSREGSGNFANDDEDDDDDDDADADDTSDEVRASDAFFNSKRSNSGSRYFRKNNNDAIKIISTPLGKVGIVYQQSSTEEDNKNKQETVDKKSTGFTDFDALSPDPESSRRLASSHPKITPVLTPDGKVALLYRGDSENTKYEPIRNLTHKFSASNKTVSLTDKTDATNEDNESRDNNYDSESADSDEGSENIDSRELTPGTGDGGKPQDNKDKVDEQRTDTANLSPTTPTTTSTFILRSQDSILPMINRPLSEVLGIKKNQFKQFRVKDMSTTTTESTPRHLTGTSNDNAGSSLHFLTKVNLADYSTSTRSRNYDFDFSRDNTMLDERTRNKDVQQGPHSNDVNVDDTSNSNGNTIANEEVLSKTEVVNLAIIPHFDEEFERLQRLREHENRRHHRQRHRHKQSDEELSGIHCIMQAMMGIAAISTVFGMLGTFFKQRILDQIRLMHW